MQIISEQGQLNSKKNLRRIHSTAMINYSMYGRPFCYTYKIWHWDTKSELDNIYIDKEINELYQGIYSAQMDFTLINKNQNLTPIGNMPTTIIKAPELENINVTKILKSSKNKFIVFYDNDSANEIYYVTSTDGVVWSNQIMLTNNGKYPNAVIDDDDNIHIVFTNNRSVLYVQLTYDGDTWLTGAIKTVQGVSVSEAYYYPLVEIETDGTIWCCYKTIVGSNYYFYARYSNNNGDTWSNRIAYPDPTASKNKANHSICIRNDVLYVFWLNVSDSAIYWSKWNGSGFDAASTLATADGSPIAISSYRNGIDWRVEVLYTINDALYLKWSENGTSFGSAHLVYYAADGYLGEYKAFSDKGHFLFVVFTHGIIPELTQVVMDIAEYLRPRGIPFAISKASKILGATSGISALSTANPFYVYEYDRRYGEAETLIPVCYVDKDTNELVINSIYSSPKYNFKRNLYIKTNFSFIDHQTDLIAGFVGKSDLPVLDYKNYTYKVHFYDEISYLEDFTLPYSQLYSNIRVDEYIRYILREYWGSRNYQIIAKCDSKTENGTWTNYGDSSGFVIDNTTYKEGSGSFSIDFIGGTGHRTIGIQNSTLSGLDLSYFKDIGIIRFWVFIADVSKITGAELRIGDNSSNCYIINTDVHYGNLYDFDRQKLVNGWNLLGFNLRWDYTSKIGNPTFIDTRYFRFYIRFTNQTTDIPDILFDDIEIYMPYVAPYYHDNSLNILNLAWFAGNKAGYEIERACMSEGARFYQDEKGTFRFETRNHYINNEEHKNSVMSFNFSNIMEISYPIEASKIINYAELIVEPRKLQEEKEVWLYGETPYIESGKMIIIWASLQDPCRSITTPVATTDYTANTQPDGSGIDKTAQISIVITKFADAAKMEITNNDADGVYLTFLRLRGEPYEKQSTILVISEDKPSQLNYGIMKSSSTMNENKYYQNTADVQSLANHIIEFYKSPLNVIQLKINGMPQLQIGDIVSVHDESINKHFAQRIYGIKHILSSDGLDTILLTRRVTKSETLNYFQIGVSAIEGGDVLSP